MTLGYGLTLVSQCLNGYLWRAQRKNNLAPIWGSAQASRDAESRDQTAS